MFGYTLSDQITMGQIANIEHTLFDRTDERSLAATWKMRLIQPSHKRMLANDITVVFCQNSTF